jgi:hypothetical protein
LPFTAPTVQTFRRFVMLDRDTVLGALSALDGGAVDEILTKRTGDSGGEFGGEVGAGPVKAKAKRGKTQRVEEELRRVRTEHSAASTLIDRLRDAGAVGVLDGACDSDVLSQLRPGMLIQLGADIRLHPLFQLDAVMNSWLTNAPKLGLQQEARELKQVMPIFQALTGGGAASGRVLMDLDTGEGQAARIVAFATRESLQVPSEDLTGHFTTLAQVDELLLGEDDELVTIRLVRGARAGKLERQAVQEGGGPIIEAAEGLGVALTEDDVTMRSPLVVLRPVCIWR